LKDASNSSDITNPDNLANSVRPEFVEGASADELLVVLKQYQKTFQKFDIFCKNEYSYSEKKRAQIFESLLLAQVYEHATLLRAITESEQRLYAPLTAIFRGLFESAVKLIWLLLECSEVNRHQQLEVSSILEEWKFKKNLHAIQVLCHCKLITQEAELTARLKEISSEYTLENVKKHNLTTLKITTDIAPYLRESKKDLYAIYRIYSGSLHGNLDALGRQYIRNGSITLFNHALERFMEIYGLSSEILESILQLFQAQAKINPSTSSGRTDVV
jgi:Family of unknown function (DUF5677)